MQHAGPQAETTVIDQRNVAFITLVELNTEVQGNVTLYEMLQEGLIPAFVRALCKIENGS